MTWTDTADFSEDFALDWGMTSETRQDLQGRINILLDDIANVVAKLKNDKYTTTQIAALIREFEIEP